MTFEIQQPDKAKRPRRQHKLEPGECAFCDHERADGNDFHPSHDASPFCDSGKHDHCSCDVCF